MLVRKWEFVNGFLKNNFLSISDKKKALFLFEMHLICTNLISSSVSGGTSCFAQKFLIFYGIFFIPFSTAASILCRTSKLSPELFLFFFVSPLPDFQLSEVLLHLLSPSSSRSSYCPCQSLKQIFNSSIAFPFSRYSTLLTLISAIKSGAFCITS